MNKEDTVEQKEFFSEDDLYCFAAISIGLASSETIRSWSYGEVKKPETINYRTFRPERGGLFCEQIFGPTRDWECFCGKFKSIRYKGVICDRCGVEITRSDIRRSRMGHIELAAPISHIWYFKRIPSWMSIILNIPTRALEKAIYYEGYLVTSSGDTPLKTGEVFSKEEYDAAREKHGNSFKVGTGAEAVRELLKKIDMKKLAYELREAMKKETGVKQRKITRRLEIVEALIRSGNKPEWMILDVIPVIPPELRPMVQLDGGRFATSDLNDLYRRVINRNNRLKKLLELRAPEIIVRNEKRMLQEAVDTLFDNGRRGRVVKGPGNRPLKSLSDILKGKQGRFRQNLLGKRVDYSGRSVIVVAPELRLDQCGLPKRMALELFKPFIMERLVRYGIVHNIKSAKRMIEREDRQVWDILEESIRDHAVLLNRAPTLHRVGIQAFKPVLVEGNAIRIHPLVCMAFNADFDGDQMAVHIPLSEEAQIEAHQILLSTQNLLSPAHGKPLVIPTQDIILGIFYLTKEEPGDLGEGKLFGSKEEALAAYDAKCIGLHARINVRLNDQRVETTVGRVIFNDVLPEEFSFINEMLDKKKLGELVSSAFKRLGTEKTVLLLDGLKRLGFAYASQYGASIGMDDLKVPKEKEEYIKKSRKREAEIFRQYHSGAISDEERYNEIVDLWTHAAENVAQAMFDRLESDKKGFNPVYMMVASGARGSKQQVRQIAGMRGLMARPSGEIIELPITSNFQEGLSVLEYFISTHGARKGLADTALKTADAGYLTRRLVDTAQDVVIAEEDCGTMNGMVVEAIRAGDEIIEPLSDRVLGRVALDDVVNPIDGRIIVRANEEINEEAVALIKEAEIERIRIRTILTCEARCGACAKCYGWDLTKQRMVSVGEAVGIIAAQSIGEPGTQLTMRTFHIGGTAYRLVEEREINFDYPIQIAEIPRAVARFEDRPMIALRQSKLVIRRVLEETSLPKGSKPLVPDGTWVNPKDEIAELTNGKKIFATTTGLFKLVAEDKAVVLSKERALPVKAGAQIMVNEGDLIEPGRTIIEFDPYNEFILTEMEGQIRFRDIVKDRTMREELDESTKLLSRAIMEDREGKFQPSIIIERGEGKPPAIYYLPHGARLVVKDGDRVKVGDVLAKFPQELFKTKDITGGLPRVSELFEVRRPKNQAMVTEIDGVVSLGEVQGRIRKVRVENKETKDVREYSVPISRHLRVHDGDEVMAGDRLIDGPVDPYDILRIKGDRKLQEYLLSEVQEVYRLQGVEINDKHIEVIIRQMLRKVEITESGDTDFLVGEQVDKFKFRDTNEKVIKKDGKPAQAKPLLLGITKASLTTESFISAASFQETTKVLADAAIYGKVDELKGLKENVIIGRLVPAGTGLIMPKVTKPVVEEEGEPIQDSKGI
ncbi:TPA: DNA-directed RNA polymerase subunit beta' [bacterium]|nr:DNA-directed RNA polymerase subunit beta' [bacterium]